MEELHTEFAISDFHRYSGTSLLSTTRDPTVSPSLYWCGYIYSSTVQMGGSPGVAISILSLLAEQMHSGSLPCHVSVPPISLYSVPTLKNWVTLWVCVHKTSPKDDLSLKVTDWWVLWVPLTDPGRATWSLYQSEPLSSALLVGAATMEALLIVSV